MRPMPLATNGLASIFDGLRKKIGSQGPKVTFERTKALLTDPNQGFVRQADEEVIGVGMSLGACHLQQDAAVFEGKFRTIVPIAGPGQDLAAVQQFANHVNNSTGSEKAKISFYWEADDVTSQFGEAHMGYGCDPQKIHIEINILSLKESSFNVLEAENHFPNGLFAGLKKFRASSQGPHIRNTLEMNHSSLRLSNQTEPALVDRILGHQAYIDPRWEKMRRIISG